jgi:hypothetical protein
MLENGTNESIKDFILSAIPTAAIGRFNVYLVREKDPGL